MNWDALGAIAELLGAVAVLATLFYLARQIRQNRESVESASAETVLSNITAAFQNAATSPELGRIIFAGQENMSSLNDSERGQFVFWFFAYQHAVVAKGAAARTEFHPVPPQPRRERKGRAARRTERRNEASAKVVV